MLGQEAAWALEELGYAAMVREPLALLVRVWRGFDLFTKKAREVLGPPPPLVGATDEDWEGLVPTPKD